MDLLHRMPLVILCQAGKSFILVANGGHLGSVPLAQTINGVTGPENISEMWRQHYSDILTSVTNVTKKEEVLTTFNDISSTDRQIITPADISAAIKRLKKGKSVGHDTLAAEHFIYSHPIIYVMLSLLFTSFITHGHMHNSIMKTIIVPLIKNKTGDINDKNNYRPIALVTAASKIFELAMLDLIEHNIETSCNQFGFKRKHATDACIYSLKNVTEYYRHKNSPVFSCYLDASRAFDRVNYWSLFSKLVKRCVPVLIVRLLSYWYNTQLFYVKWADKTSCVFKTTNGVRQGGILSPRLFSLYIDELSGRLSTSNVGCFIDGTCMNHFFYADDICLLAPSAISLQELINICATYGEEHDILYNPLKSKCMIIKPNRYKLKNT